MVIILVVFNDEILRICFQSFSELRHLFVGHQVNAIFLVVESKKGNNDI